MYPLEVQVRLGCDQYGEVHSIPETYDRSFNEEASQFEYLLGQIKHEKKPKKLQLLHDLTRRDPSIVVHLAPKRKVLRICRKEIVSREKVQKLAEKWGKNHKI